MKIKYRGKEGILIYQEKLIKSTQELQIGSYAFYLMFSSCIYWLNQSSRGEKKETVKSVDSERN